MLRNAFKNVATVRRVQTTKIAKKMSDSDSNNGELQEASVEMGNGVVADDSVSSLDHLDQMDTDLSAST